jgi:hypothetical protein
MDQVLCLVDASIETMLVADIHKKQEYFMPID